MKRLILPLLMLPAFLPASAQKLDVGKTTIECGRTGYQQPVTATFEMQNKGHRRLVIQSIKPDCGCTAVEYPHEVPAGQKFTVKMTYDARQLGHFYKMAAVTSNGSKTPVWLTMRGVVVPEAQDFSGSYPYSMDGLLLDREDLEFDDVNHGDAPVQEIHIFNNGESAMTPCLMHLPPYLSAVVSPEHLAPGHSGVITVTLNSTLLRDYGLTQTNVYMAQQLGDKVSPDRALGVSVVLLPDLKEFMDANKSLAPRLQISSTDIVFTSFDGKSKKKETVTLTNTGQSPLTISSMQLFTSGLKVTLSDRVIEPGKTADLEIIGIAEELQQLRKRPRILMITNDPDHAKVVINIKKESPTVNAQ